MNKFLFIWRDKSAGHAIVGKLLFIYYPNFGIVSIPYDETKHIEQAITAIMLHYQNGNYGKAMIVHVTATTSTL
jgi:hypothetical protein